MAENNVTGKAAVISWVWTGGTASLNGDYRSLSISETVDLADTTAGADTHKTSIPTIKSASIGYSGLYPAGMAGTAIVGALAAGNEGTLLVYPEGTATGNLARSYPAIVTGPSVDVPYSDVIAISCTFVSNGAWS
jgi:hypothetical protein